MRPATVSRDDASPLLFRHAIGRVSSAELTGRYDSALHVWVIETNAGFVPVAEATDSAHLETSTSTRIREEGDDDDFSSSQHLSVALLDTSTVTKVRQEGADDDVSIDEAFVTLKHVGVLASLATKTDVQQESDDEITASELLELETRTLNNQESIDADWSRRAFNLQNGTLLDVKDNAGCSMVH